MIEKRTSVGHSEEGGVQMQNVVRLEIEAYFSHGPMTHDSVMCQQKKVLTARRLDYGGFFATISAMKCVFLTEMGIKRRYPV